ncbi:response regulator [Rhizobium grahamii]|nr:response regulator [Rhizobium grahamii]
MCPDSFRAEHTSARGIIPLQEKQKEGPMSFNVLIVEDQPLIALNLQDTIEGLGHHSIGIASNMHQAFTLADEADIALVDVNLDDGPTGPIVGQTLAEADVAVLFMTSDPGALGGGIPGAIGVIQKPIPDADLIDAIQYVADRRAGRYDMPPPRGLVEFDAEVATAQGPQNALAR